MRIALTFNQRRSASEREAEFDSEATIVMLSSVLASLGHRVEPVDVSGSITSLIGRLRRGAPDLVFNLAEGRHGAFREAFYPALFEQLGIPHTGSPANVLALCLDKALTKRVVAAAGVRAPKGRLIREVADLAAAGRSLELPLIVKPNFEGSSKGISQDGVVERRDDLVAVVANLLFRYPEGVLVEELFDGMDVSVAWVAGLGVLTPIGYAYEPTGAHRILDLALKSGPSEAVRMQLPAALDGRTLSAVRRAAGRAFEALGVRGYGRADFRVSATGAIRFLEMNPLPSLAEGDPELYASAARVGKTRAELLAAIVGAADGRSVRRADDRRAKTAASAGNSSFTGNRVA